MEEAVLPSHHCNLMMAWSERFCLVSHILSPQKPDSNSQQVSHSAEIVFQQTTFFVRDDLRFRSSLGLLVEIRKTGCVFVSHHSEFEPCESTEFAK